MSNPRPRVVLTTTASVDGRITTNRRERLLDADVSRRWQALWPPDVPELLDRRRAWIEDHHAPTVVLEGSGTFVADEVESPWGPAGPGLGADLFEDHVPRRAPRWFAVVDGRGRVDWSYTGDDENALLVLVCRATPAGYLAHLRELQVGYLVVGDERVDLLAALERLHEALGVRTAVADGGGGVNGALLRAGLVDEVHVITFPALIGGLGTPSFIDGEALPDGGSPVRLTPRGLVRGEHGSTWAHYDVVREDDALTETP